MGIGVVSGRLGGNKWRGERAEESYPSDDFDIIGLWRHVEDVLHAGWEVEIAGSVKISAVLDVVQHIF